ncbi:CoA-binding protein [Enhydrobacter sp.]|jgi:acetyltransferase|uniref:CoA-binding protein n=1 Tax=Enhydrobacter sp. TaxID=1894999 RepID=UPI00261BAACA|nr:CoA-binding protein [Enhydrobacter sp.]WIM14404.1 MAG: CoA-binding protein [Enhydrobacter sp.]
MSAPIRDLSPFFAPRSIAVVGAGERPTSSGGAVMQMLRRAGYGGRVVPVNPRGGAIFGYESVTSIAAIDPPVDLAVIVIRPDAIVEAAGEAADRGIRNLLILPGGFAEAGPAGVARNEALLELAAARGLAIAGPNCAGIIHFDPAWRFAATFLRDLPPGAAAGAGNGLAFISQSGALAEEFIDKANARGLPLASVVSVGNAVHLGVEDYLAWLGERPEIGAALLYVESIEDHERFRAVARKVAATKPVIALFGGRTEIGGRAAAAHTGAVANEEAAIEAFCASCGIVRVDSLRRLLIAAKAFGRFPRGLGKRALILSNSGGPGVICTDRAALEGLELAPLPKPMAEVLRQRLPGEASVANPIDLLADAREDRFGLAFEATMSHAASHYDMVLMIHVVPFMVEAGPVIDRLAELAPKAPLPLMHSMMGTLPDQAEWFAKMERAGVPMFNDVEEMAEAAGLLARYPSLRRMARGDILPTIFFRDRKRA